MASPFSGSAGRLAGMWAMNQANQGANQIAGTLGEAEQRAGGYLTEAYGTGQDAMGAGYADALAALSSGYGAAPNLLTSYGQTAQDWLTGSRDVAQGALRQGEETATNWLTGSRDQAQSYLNQGQTNLRDQFGQAIGTLGGAAGLYDPLISRGMTGYDMLSNALGLGGAAGTAAAQGAFQEGPGYQWMVDQGTEAAQRAANRTGQLLGGNVVDATTRLGSNLANQEWQNWIRNLQPYQGATLAATQGKAGVLDNMARMYAGLGTGLAGLDQTSAALQQRTGQDIAGLNQRTAQDVAGLQTRAGQDISGLLSKTGSALAGLEVEEGQQYADLANTYANQLAQLAGGYGSGMAGLATGTAGNIAQAQQAATNTGIQAGTQGLLAGQQAAGNTWGAILGGLGAGSKLLGAGGTGGFGGLISALFK